MDDSIRKKSAGFTLIELMVVIAIIGILAAISMQTVSVYRRNAFYSMAEQMVRNAKVSLEAGASNENLPTSGVLFTYSASAGPLTIGDAAFIAPALQNSSNSYIYIYHNPTCAAPGCLRDYILSRPCRLDEAKAWYRYESGAEINADHIDASGWSC